MKKVLFFFLLLVYGGFFSQSVSEVPQNQFSTERILSFHSDIQVDKNGEITVTEKIKAVALGYEIRRGIYRSLPVKRNLNGKTFNNKYDIISATRNGQPEEFDIRYDNGYEKIYLGKKDYFLPNGVYNYEIKYKTKKQIGYFDKYDELYWNANGNAWDFPVDTISAKITLPEGAEILQNSCYTGAYRSKNSNCSSKILSSNSIEWSAQNLGPNEGLTVAVGFKKGVFAPPPPPTFIDKHGILIGLVLGLLFLLGYFFITWQKYGVDPEKPVVYPQFNAPQNLSPASLGYLHKEGAGKKLITASLVNLAVKGFVKIEETKKSSLGGILSRQEYVIKKLKEPDENLPKEEKILMEEFFLGRKRVKLDGDYDSKVEIAVKTYSRTLEDEHDKFLGEGNNRSKLWIPFIVITVLYFIGLFLSHSQNAEVGAIVGGVFLYVILFVIWILSMAFVREVKFSWKSVAVISLVIFMCLSVASFFKADLNFTICYIFLILSFSAFIIYSYLIKKPSQAKQETKSLIEGFKMYMGAAENEQLKFHNPPQMTPQIFETLLPYAMVLGVDKVWGNKFQNMLSQTATTYDNTWYAGHSFNAASLGSSLNSSLSSSIASASSQPSSSSSGSGGGGFSGGGGGGGGGGGW